MTTRAIETFSGPPVTDIAGRTPDGGGVPGLAVGTWQRHGASTGAARLAIDKDLSGAWNAWVRYEDNAVDNEHWEIEQNLASLVVPEEDVPVTASGDLILGLGGTRHGEQRFPQEPTGLTEVQQAGGGAGEPGLALFRKIAGITEGAITFPFPGIGGALCDVLAQVWAFRGVDPEDPVHVVGLPSFWGSSDALGPVPGLTTTIPNTLTVLVAIKQAPWNDDLEIGADGFVHIGEACAEGNFGDSAFTLLWRVDTDPVTIPPTTIEDGSSSTSPGAGCGFMVSFKLKEPPLQQEGALRYRNYASDSHPSRQRYVLANVPNQSNDQSVTICGKQFHHLAGEISAWVRLDPTALTGYELNLYRRTVTNVAVDLNVWKAGVRTVLFTSDLGARIDGGLQSFTLCVSGTGADDDPILLRQIHNNEEYQRDEIRTSDAGDLDIASGLPGVEVHDSNGPCGLGTSVQVTQWCVSDVCGECSPCDECEGGEDNPFPGGDPPQEPLPPAVQVWKHGAMRICYDGWEWRNGAFHRVLGVEVEDPQEVWKNGDMREFYVFDGETLPEPDTPGPPPRYDPCRIYPPIDAGPVIPITDRFFGMSNTPMGTLGPPSGLFNGNQTALGNYLAKDLPEYAARGCTVIGAQGGGSRIKLNGTTWDLDFFLAGTRAIIAPVYPLIAGHPRFFGYSAADDVSSSSLWGIPGGIPLDELQFAIATLKAEFPGIRFGTRMMPSQVSFNLGLDFYYCQYAAYKGTPQDFASTQYEIALGRNAFLVVCLNYLHGGDGSSGIRFANGTGRGQSANNFFCSPTEVATYIPALLNACVAVDGTAAKVPGFLGYQFNEVFLQQTDSNLTMLEAMAIGHNKVATLPPPP